MPAGGSDELGTDASTIVNGGRSSESTDKAHRPTATKTASRAGGESVEAHNKREFEKERVEDDKRRKKAEAEGWTAESIQRTFGDRYAQVRPPPCCQPISLRPT